MINNNSIKIKKIKTRELTTIGMLSAVCVVLGLTGYGFIPLPGFKATIMHIPVIIGSIIGGPIVGMTIGLIFGVFSVIQNITAPNILSFAFINPLVSVLPRVLIGLTSYYVYKLSFGKNENLRIGLATVIGSLTNTFGVLTMVYILYAAKFAVSKGIDPSIAAKTIYSLAIINGVPEAIIATIITIPVILAIKKIRKN
ncbi:ECF transporter S component [Clostridium estertheticum]|uniref:ECF transporter S component n=2 Tax=Clostridium estertheticum TaxID=238834 RepID=A0A1J0GNH0_9CLOT|nr:ECF transporter S component [Clostridium estertheticum]APC42478.1 ECF transporter S component [Clostridium estertheticum subsp. estertheticum]MBU3173730.1 ECF transporter S component [Clostridium estertheticum]MBX4262013.1 ECF transporter S component [Clostridium estertheticum]MBZ9615577.1 ECF transporter S component [Clostridium estertheticum subsp. laramiense]MPQ33851.1 ECF transporter S component [Clostridium estertheticum]